jgi:hypothetical protein
MCWLHNLILQNVLVAQCVRLLSVSCKTVNLTKRLIFCQNTFFETVYLQNKKMLWIVHSKITQVFLLNSPLLEKYTNNFAGICTQVGRVRTIFYYSAGITNWNKEILEFGHIFLVAETHYLWNVCLNQLPPLITEENNEGNCSLKTIRKF